MHPWFYFHAPAISRDFSFFLQVCTFKLVFYEKLISQKMHLKGFFLSWTNETFNLPISVKLTSQILHLKGFFLSWTDDKCRFKPQLFVKLSSQTLHLKGFFLREFIVCVASSCSSCKARITNIAIGFFPSWTGTTWMFHERIWILSNCRYKKIRMLLHKSYHPIMNAKSWSIHSYSRFVALKLGGTIPSSSCFSAAAAGRRRRR